MENKAQEEMVTISKTDLRFIICGWAGLHSMNPAVKAEVEQWRDSHSLRYVSNASKRLFDLARDEPATE